MTFSQKDSPISFIFGINKISFEELEELYVIF